MAYTIQKEIGTKRYNNKGYAYTFDDDGTKDKHNNILYKVMFDSGYITYVQANKITTGNIYDYGSPSVYGVGCPDYKGAALEKEYYQWERMFERCYNNKYHQKFPTYKGCKVSSEWHHYQVFKSDLPNLCNYRECMSNNISDRLVIDKDILSYGAKIYSKETCCIVPEPVNIFITNIKSDNTSGLIGVRQSDSGKYTVTFSYNNKTIHGGTFAALSEAVNGYYTAKEKCMIDLFKKYSWLNFRVKQGIKNFLDKQHAEQLEIVQQSQPR